MSIYFKSLYLFLQNRLIMTKTELKKYTAESIHPGFSIDCCIISYHNNQPQILLSKHIVDYWALPGGFMFKDESSDQAAYRIVQDKVKIKNLFLKQFHLFSDPQRTIMEQNEAYVAREENMVYDGSWLLQRFVSLGYYALARYDDIQLVENTDNELQWFSIDELPELYSDHKHIVDVAIHVLRNSLPIDKICFELLPIKFTMADLRKVYEFLCVEEFDRRNFQRKMLAKPYIIQLDETKNTKSYNPPILYQYDKAKMV